MKKHLVKSKAVFSREEMGPQFSLPTTFLNCFAAESFLFVPLVKLNTRSLEIIRCIKYRLKNRKGFLDELCQEKQFDWPCLSLRMSIWGVRHRRWAPHKKSVFFLNSSIPTLNFDGIFWHLTNEWKIPLCLPLVSQHWCEEHANNTITLGFSCRCKDSC